MSKLDIEKVKKFYNERHNEFGDDIKSVGWGSKESQELRFDILFRNIDVSGRTILDIGCGFGDLYHYLILRGFKEFHYIGLDISENLIESASKKYNSSNTEFFCGTIDEFKCERAIDYSVLSGALSFKVDDNISLAQSTLSRMFEMSKIACAANFLTDYADYSLEKNFHYSPEEMFSFAKKQTRFVSLHHDYPLWEFTIQMFK